MQTCRRDYDAKIVPRWASVVTVAVDTQDDRLEVEVAAWGAIKVASAAAVDRAGRMVGFTIQGAYPGAAIITSSSAPVLSYHRLYGDPGSR